MEGVTIHVFKVKLNALLLNALMYIKHICVSADEDTREKLKCQSCG